ncbi:AzlD domain-containing protein [Clostridioides difficile]
MYIVTYLPRVLPMLIFSKKEMPDFLKKNHEIYTCSNTYFLNC